jgi:ubiquinone/menaquinone biosynthesis methyltransferase
MYNQESIHPVGLLQKKEQVPFQFNRIAHRYDLATFFSQGYLEDLRRSVQHMQLKGYEILADLCCGTGKSTICCLEALPNGKVIAVDNSNEMLNQAKKKYYPIYSHDKVKFIQKDVMQLDFEDNSLDAIFMAYGIRNMPDYDLCLQNLYRTLKPGGVVCFHEYSLDDNTFSRFYWKFLGYVIIIPFSTLVTGSATIFKYLIKSVLNFPSPLIFKEKMEKAGFVDLKMYHQKSWRRPILRTFVAKKPI